MSTLVAALTPVIAKLILGKLLSSDGTAIAGSVIDLAFAKFQEGAKAREAAKFANKIAANVATSLDKTLEREGAKPDEREIVAQELAETLSSAGLARTVISADLNTEEIAKALLRLRKTVALNTREKGFYSLAIKKAAAQLRELAPILAGYATERDARILAMLKAIASSDGEILESQERLVGLLQELDKKVTEQFSTEEQFKSDYLRRYRAQVAELLDYVEILGLDDVNRDRREARLSIAYLSLTVTGKNEQPSDFRQLFPQICLTGGRLVILGGAGSGKSTLLRWAAMTCARFGERLNDTKKGLKSSQIIHFVSSFLDTHQPSSMEQEISSHRWATVAAEQFLPNALLATSKILELPKLDLSSRKPDTGTFTYLSRSLASSAILDTLNRSIDGAWVPFVIRLRDTDGSIPAPAEMPRLLLDTIGDPPKGWVESLLEDGKAIVMFDGVDEVPEGVKRDATLRGISNLAKAYPKAPIIVTSRPHAFDIEEAGLRSFKQATVDDLSPTQQAQFVESWHKAREAASPNKKYDFTAQGRQLLTRLETSRTLARLATNPLLCAAICALHDHAADTLPEDERQLCEMLTIMLADKRDRMPGRN